MSGWLIVIAFLSGAVPFSPLLGYLAQRQDIRAYGDHNPGGTNVIRAAGWRWGALALLLDSLKGALPVGLAWFMFEQRGAGLVLIALAPVLGHAFSPFLAGRGGKAVAVTFGIWTGLTLGVGPTVLGLLLGVMYALLASSGWAVLLALLAFGAFVLPYYAPLYPELTWVWLGNLALLAWKHRSELHTWPVLRPALLQRIRRSS